MIALQGYYNDGRLELTGEAPSRTASVLVIFPEEYLADQTLEEDWKTFERFTGSLSHAIDGKNELESGLKAKLVYNYVNNEERGNHSERY